MVKQFLLSKYIVIALTVTVIGVLVYSCGKSTATNPVIPPPVTCVNSHKTVSDSICNMAGTRPSYEHHIHSEYDSGRLVAHIIHDTAGIYFTVAVAPDRTVSYQNESFTLIFSNDTVFHYTNHNLPNGSFSDIFYYPQKDSFVVASLTNSTLPGITVTDIDTLFTLW